MKQSISSIAPTPVADAVAELFASQSGVATEAQLRAAGVELHQLRVYVERGEWEWVCGGVIGLRGVPELWLRTPMAVVLSSPHVAITGGTALRFHRIDGFHEYEKVHAVARVGAKPRLPEGVVLQRSRRLTDDDVMDLDGVRTTTVATALVHAAPLVDADRIGQGLDDALRRGASPGWLKQTADRWTGHGVPGSGVVGAALAERVDQRLPRSWFERLARRALQAEGIEMQHEVPVVDGKRTIAHLDLARVDLMTGVECQSWLWHSTPSARRKDALRKSRLRRLGWDIIEVWWSDLQRLDEVLIDVRGAFERQRILLAARRNL